MEMTQRQIPTSKIDRNDKNPRGINIVEQDDKLGLLRDSIEQFGILVPLVVVPRKGRYILTVRLWMSLILKSHPPTTYLKKKSTGIPTSFLVITATIPATLIFGAPCRV